MEFKGIQADFSLEKNYRPYFLHTDPVQRKIDNFKKISDDQFPWLAKMLPPIRHFSTQ